MTTLKSRIEGNIWDQIEDVVEVIKASREHNWSWARNTSCKYLNVRIDMRDGGCVILNRDGKRISPDQLRWQYSAENPNPPTDETPYNKTEIDNERSD